MAKKLSEAEVEAARKKAIRANMASNAGGKEEAKRAVNAGDADPRGGVGRSKKAKERRGSKKVGKKKGLRKRPTFN